MSPVIFLSRNIMTTIMVDNPCCKKVDFFSYPSRLGNFRCVLRLLSSPLPHLPKAEGENLPHPVPVEKSRQFEKPSEFWFFTGLLQWQKGLGSSVPWWIVMVTHSLVGPGLHSQAGEVAPKCVSLREWASEGKAAQETEGAEAPRLSRGPILRGRQPGG